MAQDVDLYFILSEIFALSNFNTEIHHLRREIEKEGGDAKISNRSKNTTWFRKGRWSRKREKHCDKTQNIFT